MYFRQIHKSDEAGDTQAHYCPPESHGRADRVDAVEISQLKDADMKSFAQCMFKLFPIKDVGLNWAMTCTSSSAEYTIGCVFW